MPLSEALLQKFSRLCSVPHDHRVHHIKKLSHKKSLKIIHYGNTDWVVIYNKSSKKVTLMGDLFCGPVPSPENRDKYHHRKHTTQRLQERFNINASYNDLQQLSSMCRSKYLHIKLANTHPQRTKNLVHFKGIDMLAVYEDSSDSVVTVMPTEYLKQEERDWLYCSKCVRYKQMLKHTKELQNVPG